MKKIRWLVPLILVAAFVLVALPASANMTGSTVAFGPGLVNEGDTLDITFTVNYVTPDLNYLWHFDATLPAAWTINSVGVAPATTGVCAEANIQGNTGQLVWWEGAQGRDTCGSWANGSVLDFVVNVTVASCAGAPWTLPWNLIGDNWGAEPRQLAGSISGVQCQDATPPAEDEEEEFVVVVPGCDVLMPVPTSAVGGKFVSDATVYWKPGEATEHVLAAGKNVLVIGLDASSQYYKVVYSCDFLWVPASTLGPNPESPWNGAALPTGVVE